MFITHNTDEFNVVLGWFGIEYDIWAVNLDGFFATVVLSFDIAQKLEMYSYQKIIVTCDLLR